VRAVPAIDAELFDLLFGLAAAVASAVLLMIVVADVAK